MSSTHPSVKLLDEDRLFEGLGVRASTSEEEDLSLTFLLLRYILERMDVSVGFTLLYLPNIRAESHLVQTCRVPEVSTPPGQASYLLTILLALNSANFERGSEDFHNFVVLLRVLFRDTGQKRDGTTDKDVPNLSQETARLEGLTRNIEGEIISCRPERCVKQAASVNEGQGNSPSTTARSHEIHFGNEAPPKSLVMNTRFTMSLTAPTAALAPCQKSGSKFGGIKSMALNETEPASPLKW